MEMLTLTLTGTDADGRPVRHKYFLVTDGGRNAGLGRASAIPLSAAAPLPEPAFVEVTSGGEDAAARRLIATLRNLPGNQGLEAELDPTPG